MLRKRIENKVGIECEVLIRNKKDELIIPSTYDYAHDDFVILGEIRAEPGKDVPDTLFNFLKSYYNYEEYIKKDKLHLDIDKGYDIITPELYSKVLKTMGTKEISSTKNIYGTDILKLTDEIVDNGKIIGHYISTGLHIHFSSDVIVTEEHAETNYIKLSNDTYVKGESKLTLADTIIYSLLNVQTIKQIIRNFDKNILSKYNIQGLPLKYRLPGFYERKNYGFEYRSLPFNKLVLDNLKDIIAYAFEELDYLKYKFTRI